MSWTLFHEKRSSQISEVGLLDPQICDLRSFGSCRIKGTDESTLDKDLSVPLMQHDMNDLRSQICFRILQKNAP